MSFGKARATSSVRETKEDVKILNNKSGLLKG